ncbi:NAD-dependent epimerase/dehydratase family protein [Luteimicrobium subarcticum]|uniref:Nucleoside-diphosphate-sugar epimerase n=1 Tax=Luteimicrobium subarcticum TaxID=620910 RepID=A0A2M8WJF8_9MICO|nr:NAD-dependent epimerase/dehydratase family protein [Luteimicrobium subarcticum]PJI91028.1 nucleoside-diphosphate-sugar epimerase [Luteimicrobium subarcticum]
MSIVITGAGPIGSSLARTYAEQGTPVRVLTRSGSGPDHPLVERRRVDVNDLPALADATRDADVVHHCIHASRYDADVWARELPAAEQRILAVAASAGATVVFPESLYAFDTTRVVTEDTPHDATGGKPGVRAALLAARAAAEAPTVSVVASDYFGPGAGGNAHAGDRMLKTATAGRTTRTFTPVDQPHSWTYLPDLAAAMIAAAALPTESDRVLLAPTSAPVTPRELVTAYARAAGHDAPRVSPVPLWLLRTLGLAVKDVRGIVEMRYLFAEPQVMDSSKSEAELGLAPTPWDEAVEATVRAYLASQR